MEKTAVEKTIVVKPYTSEQVAEHEGKVGGKSNLREIVITDDEGVEFYYLVKRPSKV